MSNDPGKPVIASQASNTSSHNAAVEHVITRNQRKKSGLSLSSPLAIFRKHSVKNLKNKSGDSISTYSDDSDDAEKRKRKTPGYVSVPHLPIMTASQEAAEVTDATLYHDTPSLPPSQEGISQFTPTPVVIQITESSIKSFSNDQPVQTNLDDPLAEREGSITPTLPSVIPKREESVTPSAIPSVRRSETPFSPDIDWFNPETVLTRPQLEGIVNFWPIFCKAAGPILKNTYRAQDDPECKEMVTQAVRTLQAASENLADKLVDLINYIEPDDYDTYGEYHNEGGIDSNPYFYNRENDLEFEDTRIDQESPQIGFTTLNDQAVVQEGEQEDVAMQEPPCPTQAPANELKDYRNPATTYGSPPPAQPTETLRPTQAPGNELYEMIQNLFQGLEQRTNKRFEDMERHIGMKLTSNVTHAPPSTVPRTSNIPTPAPQAPTWMPPPATTSANSKTNTKPKGIQRKPPPPPKIEPKSYAKVAQAQPAVTIAKVNAAAIAKTLHRDGVKSSPIADSGRKIAIQLGSAPITVPSDQAIHQALRIATTGNVPNLGPGRLVFVGWNTKKTILRLGFSMETSIMAINNVIPNLMNRLPTLQYASHGPEDSWTRLAIAGVPTGINCEGLWRVRTKEEVYRLLRDNYPNKEEFDSIVFTLTPDWIANPINIQGKGQPTSTIAFSFVDKGGVMSAKIAKHKFIKIDSKFCKIQKYVAKPPLTMCLKCTRYGHTTDQCNAKKPRCNHCGKTDHESANHSPKTCFSCKRDGLDAAASCSCAFCPACWKKGHKFNSDECPERKKFRSPIVDSLTRSMISHD